MSAQDPASPPDLDYETPAPRASRWGFALFIASLLAFLTSFLILPPLLTLAWSLVLRPQLHATQDTIGLKYAAAAFATSVFGLAIAALVLMAHFS